MLSIGKMTMGQQGYYADLAREDYYLEGGEPPGQWFGSGADAFHLKGQVDNEVFRKLFEGRFGDRNLVQNAGSEDRCPGWDLTFSAPKSVSVAWSQAGTETALEIRSAHQEAVEKALEYIEAQCGWTRRGKFGAQKEPAKLFFAAFEHGTSRAQDPQLHTHALMLNACLRQDGTTGALDTFELYYHKMAAGALYRAELTRQLEFRLGLQAERTGSTFELEGVPQDLIDEFSTRRREIEDRLRKLGASGAVASEKLALTTRDHKEQQPREDLLKEWRETGLRFGFGVEQIEALVSASGLRAEADDIFAARQAALKAVGRVTEGQATFLERDLVRFTAEEAQDKAFGADLVLSAVDDVLANSPELVRLGVIDGEVRFTTKEILEIEKDMMKRVEESIGECRFAVAGHHAEEAIEKRETITGEQATMVRHVTQSEDAIVAVTGDAGTGKTFALNAVREAFEAAGATVLGAALAGKAAQELQEGAGIESQTLHSLLWQIEKSAEQFDSEKAREQLEEWVREEKSEGRMFPWAKPIFNEEKAKERFLKYRPTSPLSPETVLIVDEAGMVGTRQMADLIKKCEETRTKLVLVGDGKQLQAVELGGAFQGIGEAVGEVRLTDIIRQKSEEDRRAVRALSEGSARAALTYYASQGSLDIASDREEAKEHLLEHWQEHGVERPEENLILCGQNIDAVGLNRAAQEKRKAEGVLSERCIRVGQEDFHQGDRILFTQNHYGLGVKNGDLGTVKIVNKFLGTLTVEMDSGKSRTISAKSYEDVKLGYAVTTHKAQGMTTGNSYILTDESMQDRELSYVQASRAEQRTKIFTTRMEAGDDLADLSRRMAKSHEKEMAIEQAKRAELLTTRKESGDDLDELSRRMAKSREKELAIEQAKRDELIMSLD